MSLVRMELHTAKIDIHNFGEAALIEFHDRRFSFRLHDYSCASDSRSTASEIKRSAYAITLPPNSDNATTVRAPSY